MRNFAGTELCIRVENLQKRSETMVVRRSKRTLISANGSFELLVSAIK